jgi:hypothetical protein
MPKTVGWRPMVKGPEEEKMSGVQYVTVSINGLTNDVNGYRHCYINLQAGGCLPDGIPWRRNSQTGLNEVYVVSKTLRTDHAISFFVMRNARVLRAEK